MTTLHSTSQFKINELTLITEYGSFELGAIFDELNLFDSLILPAMSGSIVITDAIGMDERLSLNGNEYLKVNISKGDSEFLPFVKTFRVYKVANKRNLNQTSKRYTLHFATEEFILSKQLKIAQYYTGTYSSMVMKILTETLKVPFATSRNGLSGIGAIHDSEGLHECIIPTVDPMDAMMWLARRATHNSRPEFLFYENPLGYNFMPLSVLLSYDPICSINMNPKNIESRIDKELYGARSYKVLTGSNFAKDIMNGVYAGKFVGFDTLTRTINTLKYQSNDNFVAGHNRYQAAGTNSINKFGMTPNQMENSRVVTYPFQYPRLQNEWIKNNDSKQSSIIDNTHEYVMARKSIFSNLMNRRLKLNMPGNFSLFSGENVYVESPKFSNDVYDTLDRNMTGKYIILATRHVIRYDRHDTIIEVVTNSTNKSE